MDPVNHTRFFNIFHTAVDDIYEGISTIRTAYAYGNWTRWYGFCRDEALDPLLVSYQDPVPILNTFPQKTE